MLLWKARQGKAAAQLLVALVEIVAVIYFHAPADRQPHPQPPEILRDRLSPEERGAGNICFQTKFSKPTGLLQLFQQL